MHRVGRTARAGRSGRSLILLLPEEDSYVEFLALKKVPLKPFTFPEDKEFDGAGCVLAVRDLALKDRDILENGTRAFTSFVRAYKEHQCQYIFRFQKLSLGSMARSYGLVKLPKMPEVKNHPIPIDFEELNIDTSTIKYRDLARERARQQRLTAAAPFKKNKQVGLSEKQKAAAAKKKEEEEKARKRKRKGTHQQIVEEWEELGREERLFKKLRNRKISKEEYEQEIRKRKGDRDEDGQEESGASHVGSDSD